MRGSVGTAIAVCGKFHVMNYISRLVGAGSIDRLYYSHKTGTAKNFGVPDEIGRNFPLKEFLIQGHSRVLGGRWMESLSPIYEEIWRRQALAAWQSVDLFHFICNGTCGSLLNRARAEGALTLAEVINTHPQNRADINAREAERWQLRADEATLLGRHCRTIEEASKSDAILVPSAIVEESFRSRGVGQTFYKLPYAANIARFYPDPEPRPSADGEPLKLLCVGRIGLRKGQFYLLEAVRQLGASVALTLVGAVAPECEQLLQRYSGSFRHILRVPSSEMRALLNAHDAFVLPSLEEGLAVSMCEAMACALPVITTREAGGEEIIRNGTDGLIIEARSTEALVAAITELADRDRCVQIGRNARESVASYGNWQNYADELAAIYAAMRLKRDQPP